MALPKPSHKQLAIGLVVVVTLPVVGALAWGFSQQLALARQMRMEETRLEQAMATEQDIHESLRARLEYVKSDQYVEHWARAKMKMGKPGEVVVVLPTGACEEPAVAAQPTSVPEPEAQPFWVEWWELFFGSSD
ncbi:MAG: septum formation initiator family protein [Anaerolineae bacterium]